MRLLSHPGPGMGVGHTKMDGAGPDLEGPRCAEREGAPPGGEARWGLSESCSGGRWGAAGHSGSRPALR